MRPIKRALEKFGEQGIIDLTAANAYYTFNAMMLNVARTALPAGAKGGAAAVSDEIAKNPATVSGDARSTASARQKLADSIVRRWCEPRHQGRNVLYLGNEEAPLGNS